MYRNYYDSHFSKIKDTRYWNFVEHKLTDVLIIVMCGILCGLDELQDIVTYAKSNLSFFKEHFGIDKSPSKSTLTRIMNLVDGEQVAHILINMMREILGIEGDVVAFDGKTICSTAKGNREKLHIITAYLTQSGVVLGQETVDEKTNEIPVIQAMLRYVDVQGKVVTADAMHCQKDTAELIVTGGGDYILGLKGNQPTLHDEVSLYLGDCISSKNIEMETGRTNEKNGGRFETRICYKSPSMEWFENRDDWAGLSCTFAIDRITETPKGISSERSYYISSLDVPPAELLRLTREHWKIESMHHQLDVTFSEDDCKILSSNGQKTFNIFRKLALALHKAYICTLPMKTKPSVKNNMFQALLSCSILLGVLRVSFIDS
jgi:predicted transposase YbfD/YdcC